MTTNTHNFLSYNEEIQEFLTVAYAALVRVVRKKKRKLGRHNQRAWNTIHKSNYRVEWRSSDTLTTDDIWDEMIGQPALEMSRELVMTLSQRLRPRVDPRTMGAVMRAGEKNGLLLATNDYVKSKRQGCHYRPLRVWKVL